MQAMFYAADGGVHMRQIRNSGRERRDSAAHRLCRAGSRSRV